MEPQNRTRPPRVVIITPARDEASYLRRVIRSVLNQSVRPTRWVLIDDGSSDGTLAIAHAAAATYDWIRVISRSDRGSRRLGSGVIDAFNEGLASLDCECDFIGKMDADLTFGPDYLAELLTRFEGDPRLGAASGKVFRLEKGREVEEFMIDEMVAGQWKLYRRECFSEIEGFVSAVMWDGIDIHRARQKGWTTKSFDAVALRIVHHRLMGSSDRGVYRGRVRWGRGQWFMGTHPLYAAASSLFRCLEKPRVLGGLLIGLGYFMAMVQREPRYADRSFRRELQNWQLRRLFRVASTGRVRG